MLTKVKGKIIPRGWILEHLKRDKEGITGNLDKLCSDAASGIFADKKVSDEYDGWWSSWWPGETEGNWLEGFIRLAVVLEDQELLEKAERLIEQILLYQEDDGYIGIYKKGERFGNGRRSGELWTQSRIMLSLLAYCEYRPEEGIYKALERMADCIVKQYGPLAGGRSLFEVPDEDGSKTHSLMIIDPMLRLYGILKKKEYLDFCEFLYNDYSKHGSEFAGFDLCMDRVNDPTVPFISHGPHTCEQVRIPLLIYAHTGNRKYLTAFNSAINKLKKNMTLSGSCKSDELIGAYQSHIPEEERVGLNLDECMPLPSVGYEYCSTTELMYSFIEGLKVLRDIEFADMEEWLVMNAAMAARQQDGKAIQYLCADNMYEATKQVGDRWDYSPTHTDAAVCCAPNSCKVMPYHLSRMWLEGEDALHGVFYGPSRLETEFNGQRVIIDEDTNYPFENKISFKFTLEKELSLPLKLRVPKWAKGAVVKLNGEDIETDTIKQGNGKAIFVNQTIKNGDDLELEFLCSPVIKTAVDGTKALSYGPLLYSLKIKEVAGKYYDYDVPGFHDINYTPDPSERWDYTLIYEKDSMEDYIKVAAGEVFEYPWDVSPVVLKVLMLNFWAQPNIIELVPIGCTILRRTTFPAVEK